MKIIEVLHETCVDGPGMRMSIYAAGCEHTCPACHNPSTWDFTQGRFLDDGYIQEIIDIYLANPLLSGLTFSGGDPLHQRNVQGVVAFLKSFYAQVQKEKQSVWIYTGYTVMQLANRFQLWRDGDDNRDDLLEDVFSLTDIIVDGQFVDHLKSPSLRFRGSSNQKFFAAKSFMKRYDSLLKINETRMLEFNVTGRYENIETA